MWMEMTSYEYWIYTICCYAVKAAGEVKLYQAGRGADIDLYMDQVTTFMDEHLSDCKRREDDKILTKTMINNYTKNNLYRHR